MTYQVHKRNNNNNKKNSAKIVFVPCAGNICTYAIYIFLSVENLESLREKIYYQSYENNPSCITYEERVSIMISIFLLNNNHLPGNIKLTRRDPSNFHSGIDEHIFNSKCYF